MKTGAFPSAAQSRFEAVDGFGVKVEESREEHDREVRIAADNDLHAALVIWPAVA